MQKKLFITLAAAVVAASSLTACTGLIEQVVEKAVEGTTGQKIDINTGEGGILGGAELPDGWPDVPTPSGKPTLSMSLGDGAFVASFETTDQEAKAIVDKFKTSGYEVVMQTSVAEGEQIMLKKDGMFVQLVVRAEDGKTYLDYLIGQE